MTGSTLLACTIYYSILNYEIVEKCTQHKKITSHHWKIIYFTILKKKKEIKIFLLDLLSIGNDLIFLATYSNICVKVTYLVALITVII